MESEAWRGAEERVADLLHIAMLVCVCPGLFLCTTQPQLEEVSSYRRNCLKTGGSGTGGGRPPSLLESKNAEAAATARCPVLL